MTDATNHNVVGTDNVKPSYNPQGLYHEWGMWEIFTGKEGKGKYVPKVRDKVYDDIANVTYKVVELDQLTLIAKLEPLNSNNSMTMSSTDLLFATGPGWASQNYRIFFDDTVFPYRMDVHAFCQIRSVKAAYAKIISGPLYGPHRVISKVYDAAGNFATDQVGLDLLAVEPGWVNYQIKTVRTFNCTEKFVNGDSLTVLLYSQDGHLVGNTVLTVVESNAMRDVHAPQKVITGISLKSPFLSDYNPSQLDIPLNWTVGSINLMGTVHYLGGQTVDLPVDGRKFSMDGMNQLLSSIPGHRIPMQLTYRMDDDETSTVEISAHNKGIPFPVDVVITDANYSYTVKLYAYPTWNAGTNSYTLKWYLFNLERNAFRDVTSKVRFSTSTGAFDGYKFNSVQRLQVLLDLKDIFPTYKPFVHTQIMEITLFGNPNDYYSPWVIKQVNSDALPYGGDLFALLIDNQTVKIDCGLTYENWLKKVYRQTYPLTEYPEDEDVVITPTHFVLRHNNQIAEYPIEDFNKELSIQSVMRRFDTLEVLFIRRVSSGDLYCSLAALTIQL